MTIIWCMVPEIWSMTDTIFCHFGWFLALLPPLQPKNSKFWKNKKTPGDIITLQIHKWQSYDVWFLRYGAWQTEFFVILDHFCIFTPLTTQKIKILKKWKQSLEILLFYTGVPKMTIILGMVPEIWSVMDRVVCNFGTFFDLLTP